MVNVPLPHIVRRRSFLCQIMNLHAQMRDRRIYQRNLMINLCFLSSGAQLHCRSPSQNRKNCQLTVGVQYVIHSKDFQSTSSMLNALFSVPGGFSFAVANVDYVSCSSVQTLVMTFWQRYHSVVITNSMRRWPQTKCHCKSTLTTQPVSIESLNDIWSYYCG